MKSGALERVLVTDCGSTTTKAILFQKGADGWHSTIRGEAPTTVEKPIADVTIGARNAFSEVEELWGKKLLKPVEGDQCPLLIRENANAEGIDLYLSTSSAGGGLQMMVLGVVGSMTGTSAERAALGGGAIVMDAISLDDGREPHEHVERIRHLRPDIVLIAGGTDGGTLSHPIELAELLLQADPRPRFGETVRLPVIYAGNKEAAGDVERILGARFQVTTVSNIRPSLEREDLAPARDAIHEIFLSHVMSHAPGYAKLLKWSPEDIIPTPVAFAKMISTISERLNVSVLAVDIGGATTDVFSSLRNDEGAFHLNRTVSANLGMSYSVANVLVEAGAANIQRWLPFDLSLPELEDILRNKMIRPTSIPQSYRELLIEQAVCREALRLSLEHHQKLISTESVGKKRAGVEGLFQTRSVDPLSRLRQCDLIIGSGGVLSHAPDRKSAALMMIDAFRPSGVTRLAVDSVFMLPHLGVLSGHHADAAAEVLLRDCLVPLGTSVRPEGITPRMHQRSAEVAQIELGSEVHILRAGEIRSLPLEQEGKLRLTPLQKEVDLGAGAGNPNELTVTGGAVGVILDTRSSIAPLRDLNALGIRTS